MAQDARRAAAAARPPRRQKPASMATYKRLLRKEIRRKTIEPEINFLNITAMMDMMTIILVFLLKSMSASSATIPQSDDLKIPKSVLTTEASQEGLAIVVSKSHIVVDDNLDLPRPAGSDARRRGEVQAQRRDERPLHRPPRERSAELARSRREPPGRDGEGHVVERGDHHC